MEQKYLMKYCPICARNKDDSFGMQHHVYGYINTSIFEIQEDKCLMGHDTIQLSMPCEDYEILTHISTESSFIDAMVKLHDEDIVEYELKMSQFKSQLSQTQVRNESNKPKCPTCNSTNIEKISVGKKAVGGFMFGLLSSDVRKSMHCKNCGYKW